MHSNDEFNSICTWLHQILRKSKSTDCNISSAENRGAIEQGYMSGNSSKSQRHKWITHKRLQRQLVVNYQRLLTSFHAVKYHIDSSRVKEKDIRMKSEQLILFVYFRSKSGQIDVHHHVCTRFKCTKIIVSLQIICVHTFSTQTCMRNACAFVYKVHASNKLCSTMFTYSSSWCYINLALRPLHVRACVQVLLVQCLCHDKDARLIRRKLDICVWFSLSIALCTDAKTRRLALRCPRSIY